jgi:putative peptide maturation dehydrogenase
VSTAIATRVRRSAYAFYYLDDDHVAEIVATLAGEAPTAQVLALSVATGKRHALTSDELGVLLSIPSDRWVEPDTCDLAAVEQLVAKGLILTDVPNSLREREEALARTEWNPYAALYHYMTQWSGVDIRGGREEFVLDDEARAESLAFLAEHGPPPSEFAAPKGTTRIALPAIERSGALFEQLVRRRTTRAFDPIAPVTIEQLDSVLKYVFGCHGYSHSAAEFVAIKRTSPSGGGLHPIEVYPVISNVAGLEPGIYHYHVREHELGLLEALDGADARRLTTEFMCGQTYFAAAPVSFVMTARFARNHWKYRRHHKAYSGILMDAAHLSQTLYLVSGQLGLGAFITLAINSRDIEARLGLDGVGEGVIAMTGFGPRGADGSPLEAAITAERPAAV